MKFQGVVGIIVNRQKYTKAILFILILPAVAGDVAVHFKHAAAVLLLQSTRKAGIQVYQYLKPHHSEHASKDFKQTKLIKILIFFILL